MGFGVQRGACILHSPKGEGPRDTWASGGLASPPSRGETHLKEWGPSDCFATPRTIAEKALEAPSQQRC